MAAETQKPKAEVFACCHKSNLQLSALFLYDFLKKSVQSPIILECNKYFETHSVERWVYSNTIFRLIVPCAVLTCTIYKPPAQ